MTQKIIDPETKFETCKGIREDRVSRCCWATHDADHSSKRFPNIPARIGEMVAITTSNGIQFVLIQLTYDHLLERCGF